MISALLCALLLVVIAAALFARTKKGGKRSANSTAYIEPQDQAPRAHAFSTPATQNVYDECMKFAFGVQRFDYLILGEHATVLERLEGRLSPESLDDQYLPRRPLLLPKLLQALQDEEAPRTSLADLLLQDPALAGRVLQRANSAFYRPTPERVENLERAVMVLGTRGLRALLPDLLMQPVFRLPAGYFERFAPTMWDLAQRRGLAAEAIARETRSGDPVVAQLLALIATLSSVVLFRMTADEYKAWSEVLPRAEVFIRILQGHSPPMFTVAIARSWELLDPSIVACEEQVSQIVPASMTPLGRTLYFSELLGSLAMLVSQRRYSEEGAHALLREQGLEAETLSAAWKAATQIES